MFGGVYSGGLANGERTQRRISRWVKVMEERVIVRRIKKSNNQLRGPSEI